MANGRNVQAALCQLAERADTSISDAVHQRVPGICVCGSIWGGSNLSEEMPFLHPKPACHLQLQRYQLTPLLTS